MLREHKPNFVLHCLKPPYPQAGSHWRKKKTVLNPTEVPRAVLHSLLSQRHITACYIFRSLHKILFPKSFFYSYGPTSRVWSTARISGLRPRVEIYEVDRSVLKTDLILTLEMPLPVNHIVYSIFLAYTYTL